MRIVLVSAILSLITLHAFAQVNTYTTKIGEYNGPVKTVLMTGAAGMTYDLYNPDGTLQKNVNSQKDYYVLLEWRDDIIVHNTYNRETDEYIGQSFAKYKMEEDKFTVSNDNYTYYWTFKEFTMNLIVDGKIVWSSKVTDRCTDGYTLVAYTNGQVSDKIKVSLLDPDEYGNYTRIVYMNSNGDEQESMISYEYYSEDDL